MLSTKEEINIDVKRLRKIEEVDCGLPRMTLEQQECEMVFRNTVVRESSGRIAVNLPFQRYCDSLLVSICHTRTTAISRCQPKYGIL